MKALANEGLDLLMVCFPLQTKYRESWHTLRAQGYKLTMQDIPFQAAKTSMALASDVSNTPFMNALFESTVVVIAIFIY